MTTNDYGIPERIANFKLSSDATDERGSYTRLDGTVVYHSGDPLLVTVRAEVKGKHGMVKQFSRSYDEEWLPFFVQAIAWGCGACYALSVINCGGEP